MPSRPPASRRLSYGTRLSAPPLAASPRSDTARAGCSLSPQPAASKEHEGPSEESGDEVTPPWAISKQRPREAWHETGSRVSSATTTDSPRPSPIPTALLALPRAVVVAAMKQKPTHTQPDASREARREIREWMEQAHLLKQRADILSRSVLPRHLAADKEIAEALEEETQLKRARTKEGVVIRDELRHTAELTDKFAKLVTHVAPGKDFMEELAQVMQAAEAKLMTVRERHERALHGLHDEEGSLFAQLEAFEERVRSWQTEPIAHAKESTARTGGATPRRGAARTAACSPSAEERCEDAAIEARVGEIVAELSELGGQECGWEAVEHAAYMRLRTQLLGPHPTPKPRYGPRSDGKLNRLVERAAAELPGRDEASVAAHEAAVARRELLVSERRQLLVQWRRSRAQSIAAERQQALEVIEADAPTPSFKSASDLGARRREVEKELARQKELEEWRHRKLEEHEASRAAAAAAAAAADRQRKAEAARRDKLRQAVRERAALRRAEEQALASLAAQSAGERTSGSRAEQQLQLLALQQRDASLATRRREAAAAARQDAAAARAQRIEALAAAARPAAVGALSRDCSRLSQPTQAHAARVAQLREPKPGAGATVHPVVGQPMQRAVPAWRKGL